MIRNLYISPGIIDAGTVVLQALPSWSGLWTNSSWNSWWKGWFTAELILRTGRISITPNMSLWDWKCSSSIIILGKNNLFFKKKSGDKVEEFLLNVSKLKYNFSPPCVLSKNHNQKPFSRNGLNAVLSACSFNHYVQFAELTCPMTSGPENA